MAGRQKAFSQDVQTIRDNAGGAFNHALFWKIMSPKKQRAQGEIYDKIIKDFGNFPKFKKMTERLQTDLKELNEKINKLS